MIVKSINRVLHLVGAISFEDNAVSRRVSFVSPYEVSFQTKNLMSLFSLTRLFVFVLFEPILIAKTKHQRNVLPHQHGCQFVGT